MIGRGLGFRAWAFLGLTLDPKPLGFGGLCDCAR